MFDRSTWWTTQAQCSDESSKFLCFYICIKHIKHKALASITARNQKNWGTPLRTALLNYKKEKKLLTLRSHSHLLKLKKPFPIQDVQLMAVIYYLLRSTLEVRRSHHEMVLPNASNLQHHKSPNTVSSYDYPVKSNWINWKIVPSKDPKLSAFSKKTTRFHQHKKLSLPFKESKQ